MERKVRAIKTSTKEILPKGSLEFLGYSSDSEVLIRWKAENDSWGIGWTELIYKVADAKMWADTREQ